MPLKLDCVHYKSFTYILKITDFVERTHFWTGGVEVGLNGSWLWNQTQTNILPSLWAGNQPDDDSGPGVLDCVTVYYRSIDPAVRLYTIQPDRNRRSMCKYSIQ